MGSNKKEYNDEFKMLVLQESLKKGSKDEEVAVSYNIELKTLFEWKRAFCDKTIKNISEKAKEILRQHEGFIASIFNKSNNSDLEYEKHMEKIKQASVYEETLKKDLKTAMRNLFTVSKKHPESLFSLYKKLIG